MYLLQVCRHASMLDLLSCRIKRKENVRRNYIRNTNIFYSFPEDYNDAGSTKSDSSTETDRRDSTLTTIPRSQRYESVGIPSPSSTLKKINSHLYFDELTIKAAAAETATGRYNTGPLSCPRLPNDNTYVGETSNETIEFVNGVANDTYKENKDIANGGKSVSFDPNALYAKVNKEGRTKF